MKPPRYSLEELAQRTGIEPRTIRSYIQKGLMRGPEAMGRAAYYVEHHLKRLQAIRTLKDFYGLQLKDIRGLLLKVGDGDLDVARLDPDLLADRSPEVKRTSALEFVREARRQAEAVPKPEAAAGVSATPLRPGDLPPPRGLRRDRAGGAVSLPDAVSGTPLAELLLVLRDALETDRVARKSRGETRTHVEVTPEIEIVLKGALDVDQLALVEQIADHMRAFLTGGSGYE